jgi:ABC-type lipoprotein release transport system permease subunit
MGKSVERQRNILDFTLSTLCRRKGRNTSLFFVYTLIVFLAASISFWTGAIRNEALDLLKAAPEMVIQRSVGGRHDLMPVKYIQMLQAFDGVSSIRGRLWGYYYDPVTGANYTLLVPNDFQRSPGKITVGEGVSRTRLAFRGDDMEFLASDGSVLDLEVQDILSAQSELLSSDLILLTESDFRRLSGVPDDYVTDLVVTTNESSTLSPIAAKVAELMPDTRVISRAEILNTYRDIFGWRGNMIVFTAGPVLALIILVWDKASGLSREQRCEIGILKAIGWDTADVILVKFWEGFVISLSSFLAGIILAYGHVFLAETILFQPVLKGWAVLYPSFALVPFVDFSQIGFLFVLTVPLYTLATIAPAWKAAVIDPGAIMTP